MKTKNLEKDHLDKWREICRFIWLHETINNIEVFTFNDRFVAYNQRIEFLERCYDYYEIPKEKEIKVSEITGVISYEED